MKTEMAKVTLFAAVVLALCSVAVAQVQGSCPTICSWNANLLSEYNGQEFVAVAFNSAPTLDTCVKAISLISSDYKYYNYQPVSGLCTGYKTCIGTLYYGFSNPTLSWTGVVGACKAYSACSQPLSSYPKACPVNMQWMYGNKYCCCKPGTPVPLLNWGKTYGCRALSYTTGTIEKPL